MADSRQMYLSRLAGEPEGDAPVFLRDFTLGLDVAGLSAAEVFTAGYDERKASDAIVAFTRFSGQDAAVGCVHSPAFIVEQYGGEMKYPERGIPSVLRPPVLGPGDLRKLEDASPAGKTLGAVRSHALVARRLPDVAVVANITGPLTRAGVLAGLDAVAIAIEGDPGYVERLADLGVSAAEGYLEALDADGRFDAVFLASATDNPDLFGPEAYRRLVLPGLRRTASIVHRMGRPVAFHPHGDVLSHGLLDETLDAGPDGYQFAEGCDPAAVCRAVRGRCAVMGGTDVVPTLLSGSRAEVESETRRYVEACRVPRYVFMCSCSLHTGTPLDAVSAMVAEARRLTRGRR